MGYVYIRRSGHENLFKIGKPADVEDRIGSLSTGNPHRLTEFDVIQTDDEGEWEQYLHKRLRSRRFRESTAQEFFEVTPEELKSVIQEAREFLPEFLKAKREVDRLKHEKSEDRMVAPGPEEQSMYMRLLEVREEQDRCEYERRHLENKLKLAIGTAAGLEGIASWKAIEESRFDQAAFKAARPDLFREYLKTSHKRKFDLRNSETQLDREDDD